MQIIPYLTFDGTCAEAFKFYERTLGGTILVMQNHGESPMAAHVPPDWQERILHVHLRVGDAVLLGSDRPPEDRQKPQGISVSLQIADPAEAERIFQALGENGTIQMPIQETFWALRFGMLTDRFDIPWMINCQRPA